MVAIAGIRGTGDFGTDERPKSFRETILFRNPNGQAPLTALMSKMSKKSLSDPEHSWWEEDLEQTRVQLNHGSNPAAGVTTLTILSGGLSLVAGDLLLVELTTESATYANELIEVTSVTSDTVIVVARGAANSTAATITDLSYFLKIGNVFEEGSTAPAASTRNPTKYYNYAQIFKTTYEISKTAEKTTFRTGDAKKNDKKRKMFDHSTMLEFASFFGKKYETTGANGKPKRYMGGLMEYLVAASQVKIYSSAVTANGFLDDVYEVFDYDTGMGAGDERLVFIGNAAMNALNKIATAAGVVNHTDTVKLYGMNLTKWVLPQGTLYFRTHPLMNRHSIYKNGAFIIDPTAITWRPLRDTNFKDNIQANDADTSKGMWLTEGLIEFNHLQTMKYLGNISDT